MNGPKGQKLFSQNVIIRQNDLKLPSLIVSLLIQNDRKLLSLIVHYLSEIAQTMVKIYENIFANFFSIYFLNNLKLHLQWASIFVQNNL